ncbi:O-antigen ligase family protein [Aliihoeflea sp. 40Bstr573]|uniref:O-antigen ligase family protein n=1 Tax=Aliihoeflea sp. 40Bstr573 TaxID=2696467 RepID=UPI002094C839
MFLPKSPTGQALAIQRQPLPGRQRSAGVPRSEVGFNTAHIDSSDNVLAPEATASARVSSGLQYPSHDLAAAAEPGSPHRSALAAQIRKNESAGGLAWPIGIFLCALIVPWIIPVGTMSMSVCRFILLVSMVPCIIRLLTGSALRILPADIGLVCFCAWAAAGLAVTYGPGPAIQPAGMLFIETMGAYLLGRCFIRNAADFHAMARLMTVLVMLLAPFAIYEWLTSKNLILVGFGYIFPTPAALSETRHGFTRVQGPFSHSIEFGVFCSSVLLLSVLSAARRGRARSSFVAAACVAGCALLSMSSAATAILILQIGLLGWDRILRTLAARWKLLGALIFMAYLVVEFGSNQTPVQFYISRFTFDPWTGWWRLAIWEYGSASVRNHPMFGIGFEDWLRPSWMYSASVDNFWLITAMRHGLPAVILLMGSCLWALGSVAFRHDLDGELRHYRFVYIATVVAFMLVGWTVHFWGSVYAWFMFLLGSGSWLLESPRPAKRQASSAALIEAMPATPSQRLNRLESVSPARSAHRHA